MLFVSLAKISGSTSHLNRYNSVSPNPLRFLPPSAVLLRRTGRLLLWTLSPNPQIRIPHLRGSVGETPTSATETAFANDSVDLAPGRTGLHPGGISLAHQY